ATAINQEMKIACVKAIADLAKAEASDIVANAYGGETPAFGREYLIPRPFDPRLIERPRNKILAPEGRRFPAIGIGDDVGGFGLGEVGDRLHAGDLHFLVDRGG